MKYQSSRRMCALAHGFIEGAASWYCEAVEVEHLACIGKGDRCCEFSIRWIESDDRADAA